MLDNIGAPKDPDDLFDAGVCIGATAGVIAAISVTQNNFGVCLTPESKVKTSHIIQMTLKRMKKYPYLLEQPIHSNIMFTLMDEHPCKK